MKFPDHSREQIHDLFADKWIALYDRIGDLKWDFDEIDIGDFCSGWCMAQGLSFDQSCQFYQDMIKEGYF